MSAPVVALASESTLRNRVFRSFAWDTKRANALAYHISSVRLVGYDRGLRDLATAMGVTHPAQLTDTDRLDGITQDSRGVAFQVLSTHNRDLKHFIDAQPRGLSQRALARSVRTWEAERAAWKVQQIAKTELSEGLAQAYRDVMDRNGFVVLSRAEPQGAQCPRCKALVARGWMRPDELTETPPLHPGCVHSLHVHPGIASQAQHKQRIWLGSSARTVPA